MCPLVAEISQFNLVLRYNNFKNCANCSSEEIWVSDIGGSEVSDNKCYFCRKLYYTVADNN